VNPRKFDLIFILAVLQVGRVGSGIVVNSEIIEDLWTCESFGFFETTSRVDRGEWPENRKACPPDFRNVYVFNMFASEWEIGLEHLDCPQYGRRRRTPQLGYFAFPIPVYHELVLTRPTKR
jgi:hypothetical protein